jgi:hypothetical protein
MKIKPNLESCVRVAVVILCLAALALVAFSYDSSGTLKLSIRRFDHAGTLHSAG